MGLLWPDGDRVDELSEQVQFAAPGVTFPPVEVLSVQEPCADGSPAEGCGQVEVRVEEGEDDGAEVSVAVPPDVLAADLRAGDTVKLIRTLAQNGQEVALHYFGTVRSAPLGLLLAAFVVVVVLAVAWFRALMALVGLAPATVVITQSVLPALLSGESGVLVG